MAKDGGVMASVGVIGSGTWGTALAILLNGNGHKDPKDLRKAVFVCGGIHFKWNE